MYINIDYQALGIKARLKSGLLTVPNCAYVFCPVTIGIFGG
jgi:hypothetical protein